MPKRTFSVMLLTQKNECVNINL